MKTVLIVGGASPIAEASAERLTAAGWRCLRSTSHAGASGFDFELDLTRPETVADISDNLPELDGVVVLAGMKPQRGLGDLDDSYVARMLTVHIGGPLLLLQSIRPKLAEGAGVVLAGSVAAYRGSFDPAYGAAKGGTVALARTLARNLAPRVRVNALAPGLVAETSVFGLMTDDFRQQHLDTTLMGRLATPGDCAEAIHFLLTHPHVTGVVLHLNGGQYFG